MSFFVSLEGQDFNLGDTILRRALVQQLNDSEPRHVFVGDHAKDYIGALGLVETDVIYHSYLEWYGKLQRSIRSDKSVVYIDPPGEVFPDRGSWRTSYHRMRLALRLRAGGGHIIAAGIGARTAPEAMSRLFARVEYALHTFVVWRDVASPEWFGHGEVMPDWAFGLDKIDGQEPDLARRRYCVISYRGDRPAPSKNWYAAVANFCRDKSLEPITVSQVTADNDRISEIAERLGCNAIPWDRSVGHLNQETTLRAIYRDSAIAVSDRLHVLIVAMCEGAVPTSPVSYLGEAKIQRHFDAVAVHNVSVAVKDDPAAVTDFMRQQLSRSADIWHCRIKAHKVVHQWGSRLRAIT